MKFGVHQGPSIKDVRIFFRGGKGSEIPMMQEIRRQKLGKSGSKSRNGGGGYQKRPKRLRLLWTIRDSNIMSSEDLGFSAVFSAKYVLPMLDMNFKMKK